MYIPKVIKGDFVMATPEQIFLVTTMKEMGIDRETTCTVADHLKTTDEIRSMWYWLKSFEITPNKDEIINKLFEIIIESNDRTV